MGNKHVEWFFETFGVGAYEEHYNNRSFALYTRSLSNGSIWAVSLQEFINCVAENYSNALDFVLLNLSIFDEYFKVMVGFRQNPEIYNNIFSYAEQ